MENFREEPRLELRVPVHYYDPDIFNGAYVFGGSSAPEPDAKKQVPRTDNVPSTDSAIPACNLESSLEPPTRCERRCSGSPNEA
jgi:hypothetical protein